MGIRTAWHGPGDTSPVGHAANLALDISTYNFLEFKSTQYLEKIQKKYFLDALKLEKE